jgi:serine protease Do
MKTKSLCAIFVSILLLFSVQNSNGQSESNDIQILQQTGKGIAQISAKASGAVVSVRVEIETTASGPDDEQSQIEQFFKKFFQGNPFGNNNDNDNQFFQKPSPKQKQYAVGLGSGFVVESNGYIITNYHVVSDSNDVTVKFASGSEYKAKVIGRDQATDLAVVKIKADNLPVLAFGDSDKIQVGEWVIAIGNPFGLSSTVTVGVISAKGRSGIGIEDYEDFIQTDASINMGNSGGPLIDTSGQVVGINTAIVSGSGGSVGIGFAIPSNIAKVIYEQLKTSGHVTRGYMGVLIQPLTPKLAKQFNIKSGKGILISDVMKKSPAQDAGLKTGDIIIRINDKDANDIADFRNYVAMQKPGAEAKLIIVRNGEEKTIPVKIAAMPAKGQAKESQSQEQDQEPQAKLGIAVTNLNPDLANQLGYQGQQGVVITQVEPGSPADQAGLQVGMLIMEVGHKKIADVVEFQRQVKEAISKGSVLLLVRIKDMSEYIVIDLSNE